MVLVYRVQAINTATASSNKMHDDTVAQLYGFSGGLVPGVDVWAYLSHLPAEAWGREWLAEGGLDARFVAPIYDGELVTVEAVEAIEAAGRGESLEAAGRGESLEAADRGESLEAAGHDESLEAAGHDESLDITARNQSGHACAIGRARRRISGPLPDTRAWPAAPLPEPPLPPASPEHFEDHPVLGTSQTTWRAGSSYLDSVNEHLSLFRDTNLAPPGWLLRRANDVLVHNVTLGPWIHVESRVRHLGLVTDGEVVSTRARTADAYERKGHRFVELDVLMLANDNRPVVAARHVAIYQPRRANHPAGD